LPVVTTFAREKTTVRARGRVLAGGPFDAAAGAPVEAYEIHCGRTTAHGGDAVFALTERAGAPTDALDGTRAGTVVGTYLHGCFASGVRARGRVLAGGPFGAAAGAPVEGYEIHCGRTMAHGGDAVFALTERAGAPTDALDGTRAGTVVGTYLHGCFASGALRRALLTAAASRRGVGPDPRWGAAVLADRYDRLADRVAAALDLEALGRLARCPLGALAE